ncbi:MAG: hypothetical protein ACO3IB_13985, partial [Phycisphaerales bacterium]
TDESIISYNGDYAIQIGAANVSVDGFTISNATGSAIRVMGSVAADGDVSGASIANNVISGVAIGTGSGSDVSGVITLGVNAVTSSANGFSVTNNSIAATGTIPNGTGVNGAIGVRAGASNGGALSGTMTISGNRMTGPGSAVSNSAGIYMYGTVTAAATISNNEFGDFRFAVQPQGTVVPSISGNTFKVGSATNAYDVILQNGAAGFTLGANNYWGSTAAIFAGTTNIGADISATASTFRGVALDAETNTPAQLFAIEDQISHKVDKNSRGFIRVKAGEVFVTNASATSAAAANPAENSLVNAVGAASAGNTVNIEAGNYSFGAVTLDKVLTVNGAQPETGSLGYSFTLGAADSVVLAGNAAINVDGNESDNSVTVNSGANTVDGDAGIDTAVIAGNMSAISGSET